MAPSTPAPPGAQGQPQPQPQPQAQTQTKKGVSVGTGLKNAFKTAKKLKVAVPIRRGTKDQHNDFLPQPGEAPVVVVRLQILGCMHLLAKDRGGTSDPFVVASILNTKHQTPVSKKTLNPTFASSSATFDFPLYTSLADKLGVLELVVWDKDMLTKEYLGEVAVPLEEWFGKSGGNAYGWDEEGNKPFSVDLVSTRGNTVSQGSVQIKLGFVAPPGGNVNNWEEVFNDLVRRSRPSLVSAPPTAGVGTVRSSEDGPAFEDDGGLSSDSDDDNETGDEEDDEDEDQVFVDAPEEIVKSPDTPTPLSVTASTSTSSATSTTTSTATTTPALSGTPATPANTPAQVQVQAPAPAPTPRVSTGFIPKMKLPKRLSSKSVPARSNTSSPAEVGTPSTTTSATSGLTSSSTPSTATTPLTTASSGTLSTGPKPSPGKKNKKKKKKSEFMFEGGNDIVGIVMLEIQKAEDLPKLSNMTRTGWDMDPFVVVSFGKKVFRTRVLRHSLNPVWEEKLLFHVRRYETAFKVQLAILDWDKLSANDHIGDASFDVKELIDSAPQPDEVTGLYEKGEDGGHPMKEMKLPLQTPKASVWEAKHKPTISIKAKYQPYAALRQQFWRQYLKQYDTDDTGALSHVELTSMLDSLGSTLTHSTISSFFTRFNKNPHSDELSFEEAIQCLETELGRPRSEKKRVDEDGDSTSVLATPLVGISDGRGREIKLEELDFSGRGKVEEQNTQRESVSVGGPPKIPTSSNQQPLVEVVGEGIGSAPDSSDEDDDEEEELVPLQAGGPVGTGVQAQKKKKLRFRRKKGSGSKPKISPAESETGNATPSSSDSSSSQVERVINVKNCPLCHRPRMNSKAEMDIITHLAVCASQDWNAVDKIMVGNFVTASQAQRKWYTKVISKVSAGGYKLGANSANIIVQNRMTGQLEEEKMQVYVRLGIRLLYKGASSRMEGARARKLLKSLSIKQGIKYDDPASAKEIPGFIEFHNLNVDEILDPLDSFKTFNQFFYRKLKPTARPVEAPEDPYRLVSAADSRFMAFESVSEATRIWIKGREFSVAKLLGEAYKGDVERYNGGALCIFRLAPQDYHRFHSPVEGTVGGMTYIAGEYYTVNPQAIRTALDVYGENARKIVPIDSPQFGRVMNVCVGAMMVGSIHTTVKEGEYVKRGQEYGYFAFGGSTIVVLFEKGAVQWDEDLLINGRASLETLVRVGMGIGRGNPNRA